ncbi:MAG: N-acetylmuramoyl-L-alanine amidase [Clostridium sp.]|nr:N-acetylmuramoyl-L-alanine amidase [Clostridium sp.]
MDLKSYSRKRRSLFIIALLLVLAILMLYIYKNVNLANKDSKSTYKKTLVSKNQTALKIPKDKNGNIQIEQNKIFKRYTIEIPTATKKVSYKQKNDSITINFAKNTSLKLNSSVNAKYAGEIYSNSNGGNNNLVIKKNYKDNNFVYINNGNNSNKVVVLISKVKKPFTHKAVLNPGHGGIDNGQSFGNIHEKNITLKIAKLMEGDLQYKGVKAILTRDKDEGQALSDIANFSNKNKPDVFMSIHINGMETNTEKYQGIGTYYYDENGFQHNERIKFANTILKYATKSDGWKNDGVMRDKLKVIRLSKYPSVLVEAGYLTNSQDRSRLLNDKVLGDLAENLSDGIAAYVNKK